MITGRLKLTITMMVLEIRLLIPGKRPAIKMLTLSVLVKVRKAPKSGEMMPI